VVRAHGLIDETIRHALVAGDTAWAARPVEEHLSHVFDKLGAANRSQAVARARELRLIR